MLPCLMRLPLQEAVHYPCDASTAVAQYWAQQDAAEGYLAPPSSSDSVLRRQPDASSSLLFLQLLAVNPAAARLLGTPPTPSGGASALAQQLQFRPNVKQDLQASAMHTQDVNSLAEVCRDLAARTALCCTAAGPIAAAHRPAPAQLNPPKLALCGDGLVAAVSVAYCSAPRGALLPVLVLEHSAAGCEPACTIPTQQQADFQQPEQPQQQHGQCKPDDNKDSRTAAQKGGEDLLINTSIQPSTMTAADKVMPVACRSEGSQRAKRLADQQQESSQRHLPSRRASTRSEAVWHPLQDNPG